MEKKTVLVTGIGGNVGQGIVRNIRDSNYDIIVIGCDIKAFTAGNYLCNKTYQVPYSYMDNYIESIRNIVKMESVDLIIPSTDYEIFYLSKNQNNIHCDIACSEAETAHIYLDKYRTYKYLYNHNIPFSKSWLTSEYMNSEDNIIAKPREGRGSRGILINPDNPRNLPDNYMIQPLYVGTEITTTVYVNKKNQLHGIFTMERSLTNGTTTECKVIFDYDKTLKEIANKMISLGGLKGSFNIQSIVNGNGEIIPFEINCRISGTNSIRHNLGFQDVVYTLQEYLLKIEPDEPKPTKGIGSRILLDVIYPNANNYEDLTDMNSEHIIY